VKKVAEQHAGEHAHLARLFTRLGRLGVLGLLGLDRAENGGDEPLQEEGADEAEQRRRAPPRRSLRLGAVVGDGDEVGRLVQHQVEGGRQEGAGREGRRQHSDELLVVVPKLSKEGRQEDDADERAHHDDEGGADGGAPPLRPCRGLGVLLDRLDVLAARALEVVHLALKLVRIVLAEDGDAGDAGGVDLVDDSVLSGFAHRIVARSNHVARELQRVASRRLALADGKRCEGAKGVARIRVREGLLALMFELLSEREVRVAHQDGYGHGSVWVDAILVRLRRPENLVEGADIKGGSPLEGGVVLIARAVDRQREGGER